jgi:hypothetical protein
VGGRLNRGGTFNYMKKYFIVAMALICAGIVRAEDVRSTIHLEGAGVAQVLSLYSKVAGLELVVESSTTNQSKRINLVLRSATKQEAVKALEKALKEQASVVITPLDAKRATVKLVKK